MVRRQIYVGRMRYAPTLPTEKAIPNDWFRVKALRYFSDLSAEPCDSQSIVRGVFRGDMQKHALHRMHLARNV